MGLPGLVIPVPGDANGSLPKAMAFFCVVTRKTFSFCWGCRVYKVLVSRSTVWGLGFLALRQQAVAAGSSSMDVVPLAAVCGSHLVPEMQWVVSSLNPCDVACYMESQRELSLRDAVCSTEHRTMPDRIWIAITFLAFTDDSGATYPVKAHVTLGRFEIQNDQDVTEVIAAAQRACDAVNAKLRRWATRSNLWSARTKNRDRPFPCHSHCNGNVFMCQM